MAWHIHGRRWRAFLFGLIVFLACLGSPFLWGQPPELKNSPSNQNVDLLQLNQLIADLSSTSFHTRENATSELDSLSHQDQYLPFLTTYLEAATDLEVKTRLHGIVAKRKNLQRQQQLRQFILANDPSTVLEFAGWKSFQKACGLSDRRAKFTFIELLEEYPELVYSELVNKEEAYRTLKRIEGDISETLTNPERGNLSEANVIALIYLCVSSGDLIDKGSETLANQVFSRHPFTSMATAKRIRLNPMFFVEDTSRTKHYSRMSGTLNELFSKWVGQSKNELASLTLCFNIQNATAADIARRVLHSPELQKDISLFELSMQAIARFGTKEDIPLVEKFFSDKTIIMQYQRFSVPDGSNQSLAPFQVQARDLALATVSILYGEYPFELFEGFRAHSLRGYVTETLGSPEKDGDQRRDERFQRFQNRVKNGFPPLRTLPDIEPGIR